MTTKNEIKFIRALRQKEIRKQEGLFVAEGEKLVAHLLRLACKNHTLLHTARCQNPPKNSRLVSETDMQRLTHFKTASSCMGIFYQPKINTPNLELNKILVLDDVQNAGNLGTILRLCDWFGITEIWCTPDCADVYNEKSVQASMGSVACVSVFYASRMQIVAHCQQNGFTIATADMHGKNIFTEKIPEKIALVLGNEGQGVGPELAASANLILRIPAATTSKAESLNVAMATAVFLTQICQK